MSNYFAVEIYLESNPCTSKCKCSNCQVSRSQIRSGYWELVDEFGWPLSKGSGKIEVFTTKESAQTKADSLDAEIRAARGVTVSDALSRVVQVNIGLPESDYDYDNHDICADCRACISCQMCDCASNEEVEHGHDEDDYCDGDCTATEVPNETSKPQQTEEPIKPNTVVFKLGPKGFEFVPEASSPFTAQEIKKMTPDVGPSKPCDCCQGFGCFCCNPESIESPEGLAILEALFGRVTPELIDRIKNMKH